MTDFRRFWDLGYRRLVPVIPPTAEISENSTLYKRVGTSQDGRGKTPGLRRQNGKWSSFDWTAYEGDEHDLDRWAAMGASVGIKTGVWDNTCGDDDVVSLIAIDADTLNAEHAKTIRDQVESFFGRLPVRVGQHPKAIYLLRTRGPAMKYMRVEFGDERVEILSDGRQFVADGTHPKTGKPYTWPRGLAALADVPEVETGQVIAFMHTLAKALPATTPPITEGAGNDVNQAALTGTVEAVRAAVSALPNTSEHFPSRESYLQTGYAIKAALPDHEDEAFEIFSDWCARWADGTNEPDVVASDWKRMKPPYRRGASWLYERAQELGEFDRALVWHEPVAPVELNLFGDSEEREAEERAATIKARFTFLPFDAAADMALGERTAPLIKGLLDQGAMSVMYGDSNTGKTFVAMDMGFHIGAGLPYGGMKTSKALVVYIAAEGGRGAKKRLMALRDKFGAKAAGVQFYLLATSVNLRDPAADLNPLKEALADLSARVGAPIGFLVVDTMSRALAGGDENSSVDVGLLVKNFDALRAATSAHLMVVHHSGKDRARGARGWSGLRAATDTELEVADNTITVGKQRDLDKSWSSGFALEVRTLGVDEDGDPITSCTIALCDVTTVKAGIATANEQDVLDAIDMLRATDPAAVHGVTARLLETYFAQNGSPMTAENLRYYIRQLEGKKLLDKAGRGRWVRPPLSSRDKLSERHFEEVEESGGDSEVGVFD